MLMCFCGCCLSQDMSVYTPLLLDPNACYQPLLLSFVRSPDRIYRISSAFQQNDYFSYQSYTLRGEALSSLIDYHIVPSSGKNPFSDLSATPQTSGSYDIHVTRYGQQSLPNEMPGCRQVFSNETTGDGSKPNPRSIRHNISVLMLRLYSARPPTKTWGGVAPPRVSYSDDHGATWTQLGYCDEDNRLLFNQAMKELGKEVFDEYSMLAAHLPGIAKRRCPLVDVRSADEPHMLPNMQVVDEATKSKEFVAFSNADR